MHLFSKIRPAADAQNAFYHCLTKTKNIAHTAAVKIDIFHMLFWANYKCPGNKTKNEKCWYLLVPLET